MIKHMKKGFSVGCIRGVIFEGKTCYFVDDVMEVLGQGQDIAVNGDHMAICEVFGHPVILVSDEGVRELSAETKTSSAKRFARWLNNEDVLVCSHGNLNHDLCVNFVEEGEPWNSFLVKVK